jgi:hypothetical protein
MTEHSVLPALESCASAPAKSMKRAHISQNDLSEAIQFKLLSGPRQPRLDSSSLDLYVSRHVMPST